MKFKIDSFKIDNILHLAKISLSLLGIVWMDNTIQVKIKDFSKLLDETSTGIEKYEHSVKQLLLKYENILRGFDIFSLRDWLVLNNHATDITRKIDRIQALIRTYNGQIMAFKTSLRNNQNHLQNLRHVFMKINDFVEEVNVKLNLYYNDLKSEIYRLRDNFVSFAILLLSKPLVTEVQQVEVYQRLLNELSTHSRNNSDETNSKQMVETAFEKLKQEITEEVKNLFKHNNVTNDGLNATLFAEFKADVQAKINELKISINNFSSVQNDLLEIKDIILTSDNWRATNLDKFKQEMLTNFQSLDSKISAFEKMEVEATDITSITDYMNTQFKQIDSQIKNLTSGFTVFYNDVTSAFGNLNVSESSLKQIKAELMNITSNNEERKLAIDKINESLELMRNDSEQLADLVNSRLGQENAQHLQEIFGSQRAMQVEFNEKLETLRSLLNILNINYGQLKFMITARQSSTQMNAGGFIHGGSKRRRIDNDLNDTI